MDYEVTLRVRLNAGDEAEAATMGWEIARAIESGEASNVVVDQATCEAVS